MRLRKYDESTYLTLHNRIPYTRFSEIFRITFRSRTSIELTACGARFVQKSDDIVRDSTPCAWHDDEDVQYLWLLTIYRLISMSVIRCMAWSVRPDHAHLLKILSFKYFLETLNDGDLNYPLKIMVMDIIVTLTTRIEILLVRMALSLLSAPAL